MEIPKINPTQTNAWKELKSLYNDFKDVHISNLFKTENKRAEQLTLNWDDFYVDISKNRINTTILNKLEELANQVNLPQAIEAYFSGTLINENEERAVLHTALRAQKDTPILVKGNNIIPNIEANRVKIKNFSEAIINGTKKSYTNQAFTDIVTIGIGGSHLGPSMVLESLEYYKNHLKTHFISNIDGDHVSETLKNINPETTLFIIVSKSFATKETLTNAQTVKDWFLEKTNTKEAISTNFVAVSSNISEAEKFGITAENIFPMWDWVGGRFSLWSAVGLPISLSLGYDNFNQLLEGAYKMDTHFKETPFNKNIPVTLGLLSVWYNNFFQADSEAVISYSQYLNQFATYLQQGIMESNGKSVSRNGDKIDYQTGTIIWGQTGTNSQHAFFQLFHQGTKLIPTDFIGFGESLHKDQKHHDQLISNYIAQTEALLNGRTIEELKACTCSNKLKENTIPFKTFEGNKPTTSIVINKLTPESLGKLIAMYEHKTFVQGVIWNIFSYDQFGVELGKELADNILKEFNTDATYNHDSSTKNLIDHFKKIRNKN